MKHVEQYHGLQDEKKEHQEQKQQRRKSINSKEERNEQGHYNANDGGGLSVQPRTCVRVRHPSVASDDLLSSAPLTVGSAGCYTVPSGVRFDCFDSDKIRVRILFSYVVHRNSIHMRLLHYKSMKQKKRKKHDKRRRARLRIVSGCTFR